MKNFRHLAFAAALAVLASTGLQAQFFGAPSPSGQTRHHVFSMGYTRVSERFDSHHCNINGSVTGAGGFSSGFDCSGDGRTVRSNRFWLADSYAFNDKWEINGELGGQDIRIDNIFRVEVNGQNIVDSTFSQGYRPYGGLGVRGLFVAGKHHGFGMIANTHYFGKFSQSIKGTITDPFGNVIAYTDSFGVSNHWDFNFALAYQYRWAGGSAWYIGPYGYWTNPSWNSAASLSITFLGVPYSVSGGGSTDMRPAHPYGAMTGVRVHLNDHWRLLAEAQYRSGFTGTIGFGYAF